MANGQQGSTQSVGHTDLLPNPNSPTALEDAALAAIENQKYYRQQIQARPQQLAQRFADANRQGFLDQGRAMGEMSSFQGGPAGGAAPKLYEAQQRAQFNAQNVGQRTQQAMTMQEAENNALADQMALDQQTLSMPLPSDLESDARTRVINEVGGILNGEGSQSSRIREAITSVMGNSQIKPAYVDGARMVAGKIQEFAKAARISIPHYLYRLRQSGTPIVDPQIKAEIYKLLSSIDLQDQYVDDLGLNTWGSSVFNEQFANAIE